jgi:hypothetical protein
MKIAIVAATVIASLVLGCFGPEDRRPGTHVTGSAMNDFPKDWGFSDEFREIAIQVRWREGSRVEELAGMGRPRSEGSAANRLRHLRRSVVPRG